MLGGGLKRGQVLGEYPEHLSEESDYWVKRGRMVSNKLVWERKNALIQTNPSYSYQLL
jgi:hypothetical protein